MSCAGKSLAPGFPIFLVAMRKKQLIPFLVLTTLIVLFANDVVNSITEGLLPVEQAWRNRPSGAKLPHRAAAR